MAAYNVVWECVVEHWLGVRRKTFIKNNYDPQVRKIYQVQEFQLRNFKS